MNENTTDLITQLGRLGRDLWTKGWAEANAGNISIRLSQPSSLPAEKAASPPSGPVPLQLSFPDLAGERFLLTASGSYLRHLESSPAKTLGIIELDNTGTHYHILWGLENPTNPSFRPRPTSELLVHLSAHTARLKAGCLNDRVFLHTHCPNLIALSALADLDTIRLTRLLWSAHIETILAIPDGMEFIPWQLSGSAQLAQATACALSRRRAVLWQLHGVSAIGPDPDSTFGLLEILEKTAQIYLKTISLPSPPQLLTTTQILALAQFCHLQPDPDILNALQL